MSYQHIQLTVTDGVAKILLNRPQEGNSFHLQLAEELEEVARQCLVSDQLQAVVLTGSGKLFSAGGDLAYMQASFHRLDVAIKALADRLHSAFSSLVRMPAPLVVAVNGTAAGIGLSLAMLGDITLASDKAKFIPAYTGVGLSPDGGMTHILPRIIGTKRASEMILTNRALSAAEALEWGMVSRVVPAAELSQAVDSVVQRLQQASRQSLRDVKQLLARSDNESLESQMHLEGMALAANAMSDNGKEGIQAFIDGRPPVFHKP